MQMNCILRNNHLRNSSVSVVAVYPFKHKLLAKILSMSLNTMLIVDKHCSDCCDEFPVPRIDRKSKRTVTLKILFAISMKIGKDLTKLHRV